MSKPIKVTKSIFEDAIKEFTEQLRGSLIFDGKVSFSKSYKWKNETKAKINITPLAYSKMLLLIQKFSEEVAWHGTAVRNEGDDNTFTIEDIYVYPQEVTGSTVDTDQVEYQNWLMELEDDVFNNLRMQGHSHVNMSPTASSVDLAHQESIVEQLNEDMFYIFMIWNKSMNYSARIFDFKNNTLYETEDIEVFVLDPDLALEEFAKEAEGLVKKKTYKSFKPATTVNNSSTIKKTNDIKSSKKEEVGNGWKNRGASAMEDYYDSGYGGYFNGHQYY